jgi:hypothetical protein
MNISPTLLILVACCAVFLLTPYIPYPILKMTAGTTVGSFVLLVLVLYALAMDKIVGLAAFLAVAAIFLEQRRRTVETVSKMMDSKEKPAFSVELLDKPAPDIVPGEVHPPRKDAEIEDYYFEPTEESGKNKYEPVDESFDEKQPLDTVPSQPNEVSEMLQAKGLAHIN